MVLFPPETVDVSTVRGTNSAGWLHSHTDEMPAALQGTEFENMVVELARSGNACRVSGYRVQGLGIC